MSAPIEPGHVMSKEAMQRINRDKMLNAAFNGAFAVTWIGIDLAEDATEDEKRQAARFIAQQEAKCASNGTK